MIDGLTDAQSHFVETYLMVPKFFKKKKARKRRKEAIREFASFNVRHDWVVDRIQTLTDSTIKADLMADLTVAEGIIERDPSNLDFEGGADYLARVNDQVTVSLKKQEAQTIYDAVAADIAALEAQRAADKAAGNDLGLDNQADIDLTWGFLQQHYASGMASGDLGDLDSAIKAAENLARMIAAAKSIKPFESRNDQLEGALATAKDGLRKVILNARRDLTEVSNALTALEDQVVRAFTAPKVPETLQNRLDQVTACLDLAADAGPDTLVTCAENAKAAMGTARISADTMIANHAIWQRSHERFRKIYDIVEAHTHIGEATYVKPQFDPLQAAYDLVIVKAEADKFNEASTGLEPLFAQATAVLEFADSYGRYDDIYDDRAALVDNLPDSAGWDAVVEDAIKAAELLKTQAEEKRDADDMTGAVEKLDQIPAAVSTAQRLIDHTRAFVAARQDAQDAIADLRTAPAAVQQLVDDDIDLLDRAVLAAQGLANGGSISEATQKLTNLHGFINSVKAKIETITKLQAEEVLFTARLAEADAINERNGRVAIEVYIQRLKDDETRITVQSAAKEFALALASATAAKGVHAKNIALAALAKRYLRILKALKAEIARLEGGASNADQATDAIAAARSLMVDAATAAQAETWEIAGKLVTQARAELAIGTRAAEIATQIDGAQNSEAVVGAAATFDTAFAEFESLRDSVAAGDTANTFATQFADATALAEAGRGLAQTDPDGARAAVVSGINACKAIATSIITKTQYDTRSQSVTTDHATLGTMNLDSCIDQELADIQTCLDQAAIKATALNFGGGLEDLAAAAKIIQTAAVAARFFKNVYKPAHEKFTEVIATLQDPRVVAGLADERTRLTAIDADMTTEWDARRTKAAEAKALEGWELRLRYIDLANSYITAMERYKIWYTDTGIKTLNHPAIPKKLEEIVKIIDGVDELIADRAYETASKQIYGTAYIVVRAQKMVEEYDNWKPVYDDAKIAMDGLIARDDPDMGPGHDKIAELKARFDKIEKDAEQENYDTGLKKLAGFVQACDDIEDLIDDFERYVLARDTALAEFELIAAQDTTPIAAQFARLDGKRKNALAKAAAFDYAMAITLFTELESDCATVKVTLDAVGNFGEMMDQINDIADDDVNDLKQSIQAAEATFKNLRARPPAMYLKTQLDDVAALIKQARATADIEFDQARAQITRVTVQCREFLVEMGQLDQLTDAATLAHTLADQLATHDEYGIEQVAAEAARDKVETAMKATRADYTKRAASQVEIEDAIATLRRLRNLMDQHATYKAKRETVVTDVNVKLEKHASRHVAKPDIDLATKAMADADTFADARDYPKANSELDKAANAIVTGLLRIKLAASQEPTDDDIKDILALKDGHKLLDTVINDLDPTTQRKVVSKAFKARFGCELELSKKEWVQQGDGSWVAVVSDDADMDVAGPNLLRFYELMADLPPADTMDNDSMIIFSHRGGAADGSVYFPDKREVAMREGEAKTSGIYGVSQEAELGVIHDDYRVDEGVPVSFFSWNTLHEVAHAVDDKIGFMRGHDGEAGDAYGGWIAHRQNVAPIATAVAGEFNFDKTYITEYISRGKDSKPPVPEPVGCDAEEWSRRRVASEIWVDRARSTESPWASKLAAEKCTIGNRIYHESQPGDWVSYLASARAKGVTGYQFRAPAEWFSELYAAFHSKKLKPSHPAYTWLADL